MGILSDLDYSLCAILNSRRSAALAANQQTNAGGPMNGAGAVPFPDLDYHIACLFIVFVANALPRLARQDSSAYHLDLEANENNSHCLAYSVNALMVSGCKFLFHSKPGPDRVIAKFQRLTVPLKAISNVKSGICNDKKDTWDPNVPFFTLFRNYVTVIRTCFSTYLDLTHLASKGSLSCMNPMRLAVRRIDYLCTDLQSIIRLMLARFCESKAYFCPIPNNVDIFLSNFGIIPN